MKIIFLKEVLLLQAPHRHAGSSCSEACEQLRFFSGNAARIALQVSGVADGLTKTSRKQVTVPFGGITKPSGRYFWKLSCPVLVCSPCILASGYWAFCFLFPCHPRAFLFLGTAAEQYPDKLQKHLLTCGELCLGQQPGSLPKRTAISCLFLQQPCSSYGNGIQVQAIFSHRGCDKLEFITNQILSGMCCFVSGLSRWIPAARSLFK